LGGFIGIQYQYAPLGGVATAARPLHIEFGVEGVGRIIEMRGDRQCRGGAVAKIPEEGVVVLRMGGELRLQGDADGRSIGDVEGGNRLLDADGLDGRAGTMMMRVTLYVVPLLAKVWTGIVETLAAPLAGSPKFQESVRPSPVDVSTKVRGTPGQ
jgi:hypothetical protein